MANKATIIPTHKIELGRDQNDKEVVFVTVGHYGYGETIYTVTPHKYGIIVQARYYDSENTMSDDPMCVYPIDSNKVEILI